MKLVSSRFLNAPHSQFGKWSVGLIVAMPLLFIIGTSFTSTMYADVPAGGTILNDIAARPALALTMLTGMAAGVLAFLTGLVAVITQKERSFWVFGATLVGALLLFFLAGEFIAPH